MKVKSNEVGKCPFCNSYNLDYDCVNNEDNLCYYKWQCLECKHEGEEWYSLNYIGHNVYNNNGDQKMEAFITILNNPVALALLLLLCVFSLLTWLQSSYFLLMSYFFI